MPWHHIIPKHEWKKRFGNLNGVNATDNLVNLTTEQHAQAHDFCMEITGSEYDRIASLSILARIGEEEAQKLAVRFANSGKPKSPEHRRKLSIANGGIRRRSLESYREQGKLLGPKIKCPHCSVVGGRTVMPRWHFNNCKEKFT